MFATVVVHVLSMFQQILGMTQELLELFGAIFP